MPYNLRTRLVRTPERPSSSRNLVSQRVDHIQDMLDNRSGGNQRATKRKSDKSPERARSRSTSRTSQCPSEGFRPSFSRGNFYSTEDAGTSTPPCASISSKSEEKKGRKRRFEDTEEYGKRKRTFLSPSEGTSYQATTETFPDAIPEAIPEATTEAIPETIPEAIPEATTETTSETNPEATTEATTEATPETIPETSSSCDSISTDSEEKKGRKRKSADTGEYGKRKRTFLSPSEGTSYQATTETTTETTPEAIPETIPEATPETSFSTDSEEKKGRKRKSADTGEYGKRRRTFLSPSEGTSYQATTETTTETTPEATPEIIPETTPKAIPETIPEATPETSFRSGSEEKKGRKRKSEDTGDYGKRRKTPLSSGTDTSYQGTTDTTTESTPGTSSSDEFDTFFSENSRGTFYSTGDAGKSAPASTKSEEKKGRKRKSEETEASGERTRTFLRPGEGTSHQATTETTLEAIPEDTFFSEDSGEIFYTAEDAVSRIPASTDSEEKKSRKRKSEDTGDYGKRRRTPLNPSAGTSYPWYQAPLRVLSYPFPFLFNLFFPSIPEAIPETIPETIPEAIPETIPETIPEATAETSFSYRSDTFFTDDNGEIFYTAEDAVSRIPASTDSEEKKSRKRKCEDTKDYGKRRRTPLSSGEGCSYQATTEAIPKTTSSDSDTTFPEATLFHNIADFEAKYEEEGILGEGGFGAVFAGHRKDDHLPVAIKHIRRFLCTTVDLEGEITAIPIEVALLLHLKPAAAGTSAVVSLLDWYNLGNELILVLERPVPCMDLYDYLVSIQLSIQEDMGRIITKQLVEGLQEVQSRGVFHRDIKMENILIETGSDVPRVRIIDFGCGAFLTEERYTNNKGTPIYTTPEFIRRGWSTPEATTVWQLGVVLFEMLHDGATPFHTPREIIKTVPDIRDTLSYNCQDFLARCMDKSPEARPTLETLKQHPWLV